MHIYVSENNEASQNNIEDDDLTQDPDETCKYLSFFIHHSV